MPVPLVFAVQMDERCEQALHVAPARGLRRRDMNASRIPDGASETGTQHRNESKPQLTREPAYALVVFVDQLTTGLDVHAPEIASTQRVDPSAESIARLEDLDLRSTSAKGPRRDETRHARASHDDARAAERAVPSCGGHLCLTDWPYGARWDRPWVVAPDR
jgi:hypothetical protein